MTDIGLTASELSAIRDDIEDLLPDTCTINRVSYATDSYGEADRTYSERASGVACRLDSVESITLTGFEKISQMKNFHIGEGMWFLTIPHDQIIEITDQVVVDGHSQTFEVKHVDTEKSWEGCIRAVMEDFDL